MPGHLSGRRCGCGRVSSFFLLLLFKKPAEVFEEPKILEILLVAAVDLRALLLFFLPIGIKPFLMPFLLEAAICLLLFR